MGSVGEDDSHPSSCKTFLDGCGAVNHASVPKKLRSAIKKRGRESIILELPIPKKKHGVDTLRKGSIKKPKLNKRKGQVTKDEEEVAETLYALAGMFTESKESDEPKLNQEQPETKSSAIRKGGDSINAAEGVEFKKTGSNSTEDDVKSQSLGAQQPELEHTNARVSGVQNDKCKDTFLSPTLSATGAPSSETQKSCSRIPAWFESSILSSQPRVTESSITTEKVQYGPVSVESKKISWKRCTAHVYISRLTKVMQISKSKESDPEKPAHVNQIPVINGESSSGIQRDSSEIQTDILVHNRPVRDQQIATETSAFKQGYDFLCLGTSKSVNKGGHTDEARVQYHSPYVQSQHHPAMLFPLPQNGHSSTFHTHNSAFPSQQQVPQYQSSFTARTGQQQQQTHYNNSRDSASVLNYAHALFPHLNAALAAKYQHFLPSQHQLLPFNNTLTLPLMRHQHHLPLGFDRNPENIHHLRNR